MEQLFETLKQDMDFRVQAVVFIRASLRATHVNYENLCLDPFPSRVPQPNELLLKFGDTHFTCRILGDGNYQFT
jgi:hypothetical protein